MDQTTGERPSAAKATAPDAMAKLRNRNDGKNERPHRATDAPASRRVGMGFDATFTMTVRVTVTVGAWWCNATSTATTPHALARLVELLLKPE